MQVTINLGNCPQGTLVHRTSLTQSLSCVGSWQSEGVMFMVSLGDVWEYWEPGEYKNSDKSFSCMAFTTDGLKIYMAQVKLSLKVCLKTMNQIKICFSLRDLALAAMA